MQYRAAIYIRVSDDDMRLENQVPDLERLVEARRFEVVRRYEEKITGTKKSRPAIDALMRDAKRGVFNVVVVWALDRFGRSQLNLMEMIAEFDRLGIGVVSHQETWLDTTGPARALLIPIIAWVAEQERTRLVQRTLNGLVTARAKGKTLGRPKRNIDIDAALRLRKSGLSIADVAAHLRVGTGTLHRALCGSDVPLSARQRIAKPAPQLLAMCNDPVRSSEHAGAQQEAARQPR